MQDITFLMEIQKLAIEMDELVDKYDMRDRFVSILVSGFMDEDEFGEMKMNAIYSYHLTNFIELENEWILDKINSISIKKWDYKNTDETHIGPTSEEFTNTFGVGFTKDGKEDSHLSTIDVSGVALKGVQALYEKINLQKEEIESLKTEIEQLKSLINQVINN